MGRSLVAALRELVAEDARVSTSPSVLDQHGRDLTYHEPRLPDVVVFPVSTEEVSAVLRFADEHGVAVVPFGAGTSVEGHVIPDFSEEIHESPVVSEVLPVSVDDVVCVQKLASSRSPKQSGQIDIVLQPEGLGAPPFIDCV